MGGEAQANMHGMSKDEEESTGRGAFFASSGDIFFGNTPFCPKLSGEEEKT